ncbi:hypothetical protein HaLaN_32794 [Haematococcus lacustris]|uniref:Uncharacterized protein n=1 Tax=Haematococcus lacustris TaxID=44745 RepID=A0A6A0AM74_HAELA|nr:hypothetical protein HaLaN_32794 [Haematococcus lacustris]
MQPGAAVEVARSTPGAASASHLPYNPGSIWQGGRAEQQPPISPTPMAAAGRVAWQQQVGPGFSMPCTVEHVVFAFLCHSAKGLKKTTGFLTGCNVFVCLAGAVDVHKKAADTINQLQGREREATRVAAKKH